MREEENRGGAGEKDNNDRNSGQLTAQMQTDWKIDCSCQNFYSSTFYGDGWGLVCGWMGER